MSDPLFWLGVLRLALLVAATVFFSLAAFGPFHYDLDRLEDSMRRTSKWTALGAGFAAASLAVEIVLYFVPNA